METFSELLAICVGNSLVTDEFPAQSQWRGTLIFYLIRSCINGWVNNREAGDLRRRSSHYDVTVMNITGTKSQYVARIRYCVNRTHFSGIFMS